MKEMNQYQCGYVAVVGRPNVGKSTLVNQLLGTKISITSSKAQTTRHQIQGIFTAGRLQLVFVDTPGIHQGGKKVLNKLMNKMAWHAVYDVDVIVWVLDRTKWLEEDERILSQLKEIKKPVVIVINKIDLLKDKSRLLPFLSMLQEKIDASAVVPLSAIKQTQLDTLISELARLVPTSESLWYPAQTITDRSMAFRMAELIREKLTIYLDQELPYELAVEIEQLKKEAKSIDLHALIWVDKESQKGIVIGKGGQRLKTIGQAARMEIEKVFRKKVHLQLWVKIKSGWMNDKKLLKTLGYDDNESGVQDA